MKFFNNTKTDEIIIKRGLALKKSGTDYILVAGRETSGNKIIFWRVGK